MSQQAALQPAPSPRPLLRGLQAFALWLRPREGYLAVLLLMAHLLVVVWNVERTEWVQTPNMAVTLVLAVVAGLLLSKLRVHAVFLVPVGLALGFGLIVWQLVAYQPTHSDVATVGDLFDRLGIWLDAAQEESISIDSIPFAFVLMVATWCIGFFAAWSLFRHHRYSGVVILGGVAMALNLTNIEKAPIADWMLYVFTAIMLLVRVHTVHRQNDWERRGLQYDRGVTWFGLSDGLWFAVAILLMALVLPYNQGFRPLNSVYKWFSSPSGGLSEDFNRLFAGLPGKKPRPYRDFSHVLPLRGTIKNTANPVLKVESPYPLYLKVRSYSVYTSKGWTMGDTSLQFPGWRPEVEMKPVEYEDRLPVEQRITAVFTNKNIFTGGQVLAAPRATYFETYDSPKYVLDLREPDWRDQLPTGSEDVSDLVVLASEQFGRGNAEAFLEQRLPSDWKVESVGRPLGSPEVFTLRIAVPNPPEVLYLHPGDSRVKPGETYAATTSVSFATAEELRGAGEEYPAWVMARYLQLPETLPPRVRELADELTAPWDAPYDKAKAIERHLKTFEYTKEIDAPPFDADGVDHFLFDSQQGYSEYFGSAMTVLLRATGMPARLATGYNYGSATERDGTYVIKDDDSHAWTEAYFPEYGWITFEPTPGNVKARLAVPEELGGLGGLLDLPLDLADGFLEEDELLLEGSFGVGGPLVPENESRQYYWLLYFLLIPVALWVLWQLLWYRFMRPSVDPVVAFQRLALLTRLGGLPPILGQTPFQYRDQLQYAFPTKARHLEVLVGAYVRTLYGRKELTDAQRGAVATAWVQLRGQLLLRIFRRG